MVIEFANFFFQEHEVPHTVDALPASRLGSDLLNRLLDFLDLFSGVGQLLLKQHALRAV